MADDFGHKLATDTHYAAWISNCNIQLLQLCSYVCVGTRPTTNFECAWLRYWSASTSCTNGTRLGAPSHCSSLGASYLRAGDTLEPRHVLVFVHRAIFFLHTRHRHLPLTDNFTQKYILGLRRVWFYTLLHMRSEIVRTRIRKRIQVGFLCNYVHKNYDTQV